MTENKRFVNIGNEIHLNGEWWCSANGEHCADVITTALNELNDENEQLKNMVRHNYVEHKRCVNNYVDKIKEVEKENEQLKQSYKEFEDECQSTFNAMSRKQNDLYRKNFKLKEENEQLKQQIENMAFILRQNGLGLMEDDD